MKNSKQSAKREPLGERFRNPFPPVEARLGETRAFTEADFEIARGGS